MASFDPFAGAGKDIFTEESGPGVPARTRRQMRGIESGINSGAVTSVSPQEQYSLTALEELSKNLAAGTGPQAETFNLGRNTLADVLQQLGPGFENYYQTNIENPLLRTFSEKVLPQLDVNLARSGYYGSARERSLGARTDELMRALTEGRTGLQKELFGTRLTGAGMAPGLAAPEVDTLRTLLETGDVKRQRQLQQLALMFQLANLANVSNAPGQQSDLFSQQANEASDARTQQAILDFLTGAGGGGGSRRVEG